MPRRGMNGRWISEDQEASDQLMVEAILSMLLLVGFVVALITAAINCGGPGLPLCP